MLRGLGMLLLLCCAFHCPVSVPCARGLSRQIGVALIHNRAVESRATDELISA